MKKFIFREWPLILAIVILIVAVMLSSNNRQGLYGEMVIGTGQFSCNGENLTAEWTNDTGRILKVRQAEMWLGMFQGSEADFWVWLSATGSGTMGHTNWDHYDEPTGFHNLRYVYAPDYVQLKPGDVVTLRYGCNDIGQGGSVGDVTVTLWWLQ